MKLFDCQHCGQIVYFENSRCEQCGHALGFLPGEMTLSALEENGDGTLKALAAPETPVKFCANAQHGVCNWLVPVDDSHDLCEACQLNRTIPDLSAPDNQRLWQVMELAKHRLVYGLYRLGLPVLTREEDPEHGLAFDFLSDGGGTLGEHVMTGHDSGLITLNLAEADDVHRERTRQGLDEPYRTVLGHFRHEIGHYYWDLLVQSDDARLEECRSLFGDDREDYQAAIDRHYAEGPPADWQQHFISSYATMHPWEDFAETFAHYLHMSSTLETASSFGLNIRPKPGHHEGRMAANRTRFDFHEPGSDFDSMVAAFVPLTTALNTLNKSMGKRDLYPFVLNEDVVAKLRFVHETVQAAASRG